MKYAFIAEHRPIFSIRAMCRCLRVQPSGFYAWLKAPLSKRAQEDQRQTDLIRAAWSESGKLYGYRKLHDDLADMGESCCPNRVARLTRLAGIRAQIGYRRLACPYLVVRFESRAVSDHIGSYPAASKKFRHCWGVKRSVMRPMAVHRPSTVCSAALRRWALSLAKAFSIGLKSGL